MRVGPSPISGAVLTTAEAVISPPVAIARILVTANYKTIVAAHCRAATIVFLFDGSHHNRLTISAVFQSFYHPKSTIRCTSIYGL